MAKKQTASKGIAKENGAVRNAERDLNKAKARKKDLEADLCETEKNIERIETDRENQTQKAEAMAQQKCECQECVKQAENKLKEASAKCTDLDTEEVDLRRKLNDLSHKLDDQTNVVSHARAKADGINAELSSLHLDYVQCIERLPEHVSEIEEEENLAFQEAIENEREFIRKLAQGEVVAKADKTGIIKLYEMPTFSPEEIENFVVNDIRFALTTLEKRKSGKTSNLSHLQDYIAKLERYDRELDRLKEISMKKDQHRKFCEELKAMRLCEFMDGFSQIGVALKEMYQMITLGGDASLDLVDSLDPFSEGVSFGVRPPKKSWKQITNLSGGEKTLSSLALVFALHHYRPTPLYVMDEIDAALDFRNVSIIAHYVKDRTKNAQFIIISLRNNMFELGDRLVGIYKTFDCTKNVLVEASKICETMRCQRAVLDALDGADLSQQDRAVLQPPKVAKGSNGPNKCSQALDGQCDENDAPEVARRASDASTSHQHSSVSIHPVTSKNDEGGIPPFRGDRKMLSPVRKRQVAEFVKYTDRTKKLTEPLERLETEQAKSSISPPLKKQRSPRKNSSSPRSKTGSESAERQRSARKSRRAAVFAKPVIDLETSEETLGDDSLQTESRMCSSDNSN